VRKAAHLTEFALLGGLWCSTARTYDRRRLWLWGMATGAVDECLQFLAPGRAPMVTDVLLDTFGYVCGVGLVWFIAYLCRKKQK
jgi:VanZ family protein